jgi:hypothetical protein
MAVLCLTIMDRCNPFNLELHSTNAWLAVCLAEIGDFRMLGTTRHAPRGLQHYAALLVRSEDDLMLRRSEHTVSNHRR